jgi:lipid-binding SYLF domain-containing protein
MFLNRKCRVDHRAVFFSLMRSCILVLLVSGLAPAGKALAKSVAGINSGVQETLKQFRSEVKGGSKFLGQANGVLVFPSVYKGGLGIGAGYGEGALLVGGKTVDYYNTVAAIIGFRLGAQKKSVVVAFTTTGAPAEFRRSDGWKAGVDGPVALIEWGVGEDINTADIKDRGWSVSCAATRVSCITSPWKAPSSPGSGNSRG